MNNDMRKLFFRLKSATVRQPTWLLIIAILAAGVAYSLHELIAIAIDHWNKPSLHGDSFTFIIRGNGKPLGEWIIGQHNEHRIIWAKLASVFETNVLKIPPGQSALFQNLFLMLATVGQWSWLCQRLLRRPNTRLMIALAGSLIILNPWQYENIRWEFQTPWFLINALVLTGALILTNQAKKRRDRNLVIVIALSLPWIALSSTGQGIALAMAFIACAWIRNHKLGALVSGSTGLAILTFYVLLPYSKPESHPDFSFQLSYFLKAWLGGPWQGLTLLCVVIAAALLGRQQTLPVSSWPAVLMPGLFSLLFAGMITLSRSGFGLDQANSSRYVTHSLMLGLSALMALALADDQNGTDQPQLLGSFLVLIATLGSLPQSLNAAGMSYSQAWQEARSGQERKRNGLTCHARQAVLERSKISLLESCKGIFPDPTIPNLYFQGAWPVKPMGWHKNLLEVESSIRSGAISSNLERQVLTPTSNQLEGWAYMESAPNQQLFLLADYGRSKQLAVPINKPRRDVKRAHKLPTKNVGFNAALPLTHEGQPLRAVRIGTPNQSVQIWEDPSADG